MRNEYLVTWITNLIKNNNIHEFYSSTQWRSLSADVLKEQKYECQICKGKKLYTKAVLVHHVKHVRQYPWLALSWHDEAGNINLISLCSACHNEIHKSSTKGFTNEERW